MIEIDDIAVGEGPEVKDGDTVEMHYTGSFPNGKVFDTSKGGKTFSFRVGVGQVIKGFDMGVLGMKVGGQRKLTIPSELGYGSRGAGKAIPPDSILVFELELVSIR
jgi:FKBP-type peptidyl-prolyl cis-trans isomerase